MDTDIGDNDNCQTASSPSYLQTEAGVKMQHPFQLDYKQTKPILIQKTACYSVVLL